MQSVGATARRWPRWERRLAVAIAFTGALSLLGLLWVTRASGVAILNPVYQLETVSNGHESSLPLQLGQPGVPAVPRPVDVNGDLISDVIVVVNVVDAKALLGLPPDADAVLAPNIEIYRDPAAVALCKPDIKLLAKCTPPLKIQVKLQVQDSGDLSKSQVIRFGYDTGNNGGVPNCVTAPCADNRGRIGSIPPYFKATLLGLADFFNPLTAQISTHGYAIVGTPLVDTEAKNGYEGPLDIVGSIGDAKGILSLDPGNVINPQDTPTSELRMGYRPWPGNITLGYLSDDEGEHIVYDHARKSEVDVNTHLGLFEREDDVLTSTVLEARVDRMPRHITLDVKTGDRSGEIKYRASPDGRLPDVKVSALSERLQVVEKGQPKDPTALTRLQQRLLGSRVLQHTGLFVGLNPPDPAVEYIPLEAPLLADVDIEGLPSVMQGRWSFPTDGPVSGLFCGGDVDVADECQASGNGVGAADAKIQDFYAAPTAVTPFTPAEQQFLSFRTALGGVFEKESLIAGRIEQIRELRFNQSDDGFSARTRLGDGELPLQMDVASNDIADGEGLDLRAVATIAPLPDDIRVSLTEPGDDQKANPLSLVYESSKSVDVTSHLEVRLADAAANATCGRTSTVCGDLRIRHIPAKIEVKVRTFPSEMGDLNPGELFDESRVDIDTTPRPGASKPDFFADLTLGQEDATGPGTDPPVAEPNPPDDVPLIAHAELLQLPPHVRIRAREGNDATLDRLEVHTCDRDFDANPPVCVAGTDDPQGVGALSVNLRNWTTRPAGLPILVPSTPLWATIAVRGKPAPSTDVNFEAAARITNVREVQYRNTGNIFGIQTRVGADQDFSAKFDAGNLDFPDDDPKNGRIDATGEATVSPLPGLFNLCFRSAHEKIQTLSDTFTDACETDKPFTRDTKNTAALTESPTTVHYCGASFTSATCPSNTEGFDISARMLLRQRGLTDPGIADDHTIRGRLNLKNLPNEGTVNFQAPVDDNGDNVVDPGEKDPIRAQFDATAGAPVTLDFGVEVTDGDLVCEDPRTPPAKKKALCVSGRIQDLPTAAFFRYDPNVRTDNLEVSTNTNISVKNMVFSSVEGARVCEPVSLDCPLFLFNKIVPKVLVAEGQILNLPNVVTGTLDLPKDDDDPDTPEDAPTVKITASPPIGQVDATVRNFITPDPFIDPVPARSTGFAAPDQEITFRQLGASFKAEAHIKDVAGVGYRTVKDADGKPLETKEVTIDFGHGNHVVRAYADLQETQEERTIADVTVHDLPKGVKVCFRGDPNEKEPGTNEATYCDVGDDLIPVPNTNGKDQPNGAFQFLATPGSPGASPLDVDGFVRHAKGGGGQVLAARIHIDNIPFRVQGTIIKKGESGDLEGDLDVGGFTENGTPDGIDRIEANAATFDLTDADTGYGANRPYQPVTNATPPFPLAASPNQHLKAAFVDEAFQIRARIGTASELQRVKMLSRACDAPPNNPSDYPRYEPTPTDDPATLDVDESTLPPQYTCVMGIFSPSATANDQLDVDFYKQEGQDLVSFTDGGLTDIPSRFQLTLADDETLNQDPKTTLRPRCGSVTQPRVNGGNCMAPLVRFDQPDDSVLFGVLRKGFLSDLVKLDKGPNGEPAEIRPLEKMADLDGNPTADGWENDWPAGTRGVRAKIASFEGGSTAIKAAVRLDVPKSLTVDQLQQWSKSVRQDRPNYWEASDTRFHYVVRDGGNLADVVGSVGELALLKHGDDGTQILVSKPCDAAFGPRSKEPDNTDDCPEFLRGIPIPGELAMDIYQRKHNGHGRDFMQIDGRLSQPTDSNGQPTAMNIGARVVGGPTSAIGRLEADVRNVPAVDNTTAAGDPSFRLRVELLGEGEDPPTVTGGEPPPSEPEDECTAFLCFKKEVNLKSIWSKFDFRPAQTAAKARLVEAVVNNTGSLTQGVQVKSLDSIRGGSAAPVTVRAMLDVDPINVFLHAGLPLIGGADFILRSQLQAGITLNRITDFELRHNTLHVRASRKSDDSSVKSGIGPINYYIYLMHGSAYGLFVKLFGVDFFPPSAPPEAGQPPGFPAGPVDITFIPCTGTELFKPFTDPDEYLDGVVGNTLAVGNSERNVVLWPFLDERIHFSGLFGGIGYLAKILAGPFFCATDVDSDSIPLFVPGEVPGDPIPVSDAPSQVGSGHPVPDANTDGEAFNAPSQPSPDPLADVTIDSPVSWCGTKSFRTLTINSTITVATAANGDDCPGGDDSGTLAIFADQIDVNGKIDGSEKINFLQPQGSVPMVNGGAGHGGAGGKGGAAGSSGGGTYGSTANDPTAEVFVGGKGAGGAAAGKGGARVLLQAKQINVASGGQIIARGQTATAAGDADCSEDGVRSPGPGGGSGGGIVLTAFKVTVSGSTVSANGGSGRSGGAGGGGGGGGGLVKVFSPLISGTSALSANGGTGGAGLCGSTAGSNGSKKDPILAEGPQSQPTFPLTTGPKPVAKFWNRDESSQGANLSIPVTAAAKGGNFQVYVCGYSKSPETVAQQAEDNNGVELNALFPVFQPIPPSSVGGFTLPGIPCGGATQISARTFSSSFFDGTIGTDANMGSGYWGIWTFATKGSNCFSTPAQYVACDRESPIAVPGKAADGEHDQVNADLVLGIDNDNPGGGEDPPEKLIFAPSADFVTSSTKIGLDVRAQDQPTLSGLEGVVCTDNNFASSASCGSEWTFTNTSNGTKTIKARATDLAGNQTTDSVSGILDRAAPTQSASLIGGILTNGWYRVRPTIRLSGEDDLSGLASPGFRYRFDEGDERSCTATPSSPCDIPASEVNDLFLGQHTVHFTAVDAAGNRYPFDHDHKPKTPPLPMPFKTLKIDSKAPLSALTTVPRAPNGANGYFTQRPWIVLSAVDQVGASGVNPNVSPSGIFYSKNGGAFTKYTGPFQLTPGSYNFCWYAVDVAGNQEATHCTGDPIKVDDAAPAVTINAPGPDGLNGWYKTQPTATVQATDATPGSGFSPSLSSTLCDGKAKDFAQPQPSGLCVSLDGGPFQPQAAVAASFLIREGLHTIQAFAVDASGQPSPVVAAAYMVDRSEPVTTARMIPPTPATGVWFRRVAQLVLRATDGELNAGLQKIQYKLDAAGFVDYVTPIQIPAGVHTVQFKATDLAGRVEVFKTMTVNVDTGPTIVRALQSQPLAFSPRLGQTTTVSWMVKDDLSHKVTSMVIVYTALGLPVRHLQDVPKAVTPNTQKTLSMKWDGKDDGLAGVVPGIYYYRVMVVDEAGNISMSGESAPITVKA
jgi:hypothetical protein